jgi:hypothetical protein
MLPPAQIPQESEMAPAAHFQHDSTYVPLSLFRQVSAGSRAAFPARAKVFGERRASGRIAMRIANHPYW